jgi:hypothetical protein
MVCAAAPAGAAEPVCGTVPAGASQPAKATLSLLDTDPETVTTALYGRKTGVKQLTLVYAVSGCVPTQGLDPPHDPPHIGPSKDVKVETIPRGVIRLAGTPKFDGHVYVVRLQVDTNPPPYKEQTTGKTIAPGFPTGTYAGFVHLDADWIPRNGSLVAVSRSENRWLYVLGLAALGALGGFAAFMLLHAFSRAALLTSGPKIAVAGVVSVAVGAYVAYTTNYLNQDVWTLGANTIALLTAAFTAATTGQLVTGLLGKVYDDHGKVNPPRTVAGGNSGKPRRALRLRRSAADKTASRTNTNASHGALAPANDER